MTQSRAVAVFDSVKNQYNDFKRICAPEDTLPLLLSVGLLFITSCVTCFAVSNILISPAWWWGHVVCLWSSRASIPHYGINQHCNQEHKSLSTDNSVETLVDIKVIDQQKYITVGYKSLDRK